MKKLFTILSAALMSVSVFAELAYNAALTENDFNNSSTVVKKEGTIEWDGGAVRCGGSSTSIIGGPAYNWDDKYFDVKLAAGVPKQLTFQYKGNSGASTGVEYYVKESVDGENWTDVWSTTSNSTNYVSVSKELTATTKYLRFCFSGNFAGLFKDVKVTEKILMGTPNPESIDFGTVKVDDVVEGQTFTLGWTNLTGTATSSDSHFTVTPDTFGEIGANLQTTTFTVGLQTSEAGAFSGTITLEGRGKSAQVAVSGTVEKYNQTINWEAAESVNFGEAIALATATSGLDVTYEIADPAILKFENGAFVTLYAGTTQVTAKQAGNYKYNAAEDVVKNITVVAPTTYGDFVESSCDTPVEFNGTPYSESFAGDVKVGLNYMGGDSIVHVAITINHATTGTDEMQIVYGTDTAWNGIALKDSTVGVHSVIYVTTNAVGCDSTVTLTLTVNKQETLNVPVELSFCEGGSQEYRGVEYTEAGTFEVPAEGATRDTLYVINVTVLQPSFSTDEMQIVYGTDTAWNGIALNDSTVGVHYVVYETTNAVGCDSTVTLTLTVTKANTVEVPVELAFCEGDSAEYRGTYYTAAGLYPVYAEGAIADTVYNVNVTVNQPYYNEDELTKTVGEAVLFEEDGWLLRGETPVEGVYMTTKADTMDLWFVYYGQTVLGCDSVERLNVTVELQDPYETEAELEMCEGESVEYRGVEYSIAGEYPVLVEDEIRDTLINVIVTVHEKAYAEIERTVLAGEVLTLPEGEWMIGDQVVSGTYETLRGDTMGLELYQYDETEFGCESVVKLIVTVTPNYEAIDNIFVGEKAVKEFRNGILYIRRGGKEFTTDGQMVK